MKKPLLILGGGGHAKVLIDILKLLNCTIIGIIDPALNTGEKVLGIPIIGNDEKVFDYHPESVELINGLGSTHKTERRKAIFNDFKKRGYFFPTIVHPSAVIATSVDLKEGIQIMAGSIIQPGSSIGYNTIINTSGSIDHDCQIGDHVHVAPGVTLSGKVSLGDRVHIGTGAIVIQGIHIGRKSLIGAGSTVTQNIPDNVTAYGVPAKVVVPSINQNR